jgi:hypothetical protein
MTVHIVTLQLWEDVEILGVFGDIGKADDFVATLPETDRINARVNTYLVN